MPCTHDGHLHYHRIAALRHAWENDVFFTRWLPDLAFGYGYPFFNYREAPPLYIPLIPHLLGMPLPAASNLFYALTILAAGVFMFLWVRDLFGERAGLVSALAYMSAPYVLVDALVRGNSPESLALPLFPFLLWTGRRWVRDGSAGWFLAGVLGLALLSLSHNISTFIFVPSLFVYLAVIIRLKPDKRRAGLLRLLALFVLGLGVAFFYTGGALLEIDQVTLEQSTTTRNNDWRFNFASLTEILAPVAAEDPNLVNPPLYFRLGWAPLALAALGVTGLAWIKGGDSLARERRAHIWLMLVAAFVYLFMALPLSRTVWEALPLIDFVQFPWRFVGRAALPVALLAGAPFAHPFFAAGEASGGRRLWPAVVLSGALLLLLAEALPNLYPRFCREDGFPTIQTVHAYERITGLVGVDPEGSYFPRTVKERPTGSPLEADYQAGRTPQRFDPAALPPGATVGDVVYGRQGVNLAVNSPEPFTARYLSFAFPGWTATVDGRQAAITPEDPSGLITFPVPAGAHTVSVQWGTTPLRTTLAILSLLAAAATVGLTLRLRKRATAGATDQTRARLRRPEALAVLLVGLGVLAFKVVVVDRGETLWRRPAGPDVAVASLLQGGELRLEGYTLSRETVPSGESFDIDLAWTAVAPPAADYQSAIRLVGPDGLIWSDKATERPRPYEDAPPTRLWEPGEWGWDSHEVSVLSGAPPGAYDLVLTLFDKATLQPLTLRDAAGQAIGPEAVIGRVNLANPEWPPDFDPQFPLAEDVGKLGLRLLGYNQDRVAVAPGDSLLLTLFWERLSAEPAGSFRLALQDESGTTAQGWELPVTRADFSPEQWAAGQRLRGQHLLQLPANLPDGRYHFILEDSIPLGVLQVDASERRFESPPLTTSVDVNFYLPDGSTAATLVGLADEATPAPLCETNRLTLPACSVSLVWLARTELPDSYHVFVHLVDETGRIVAQSDQIPAAWTRPTTGWLPGEYVVDTHSLSLPDDLPPGRLHLRAGLYNPATGERLMTDSGDYAALP